MKKVLLLFALTLGSSAFVGCDDFNDLNPVLSEEGIQAEEEGIQDRQDRAVNAPVPGRITPLTDTSGTWTCTNQEGTSRSYTIFKPGRSEGLACELIDKTGKLLWYANNEPNYCEKRMPDILNGLQAQGFSCQ